MNHFFCLFLIDLKCVYVIVEALMFVAAAAEAAWGSDQGSTGVGVVLGETRINAALQQRWRFPAQLNLQRRLVATRWRHMSGCHVDAGLPQSVHTLGVEPRTNFWTASPHYCSALKASSQNGFRVRTLVSCVTRQRQPSVCCSPFICQNLNHAGLVDTTHFAPIKTENEGLFSISESSTSTLHDLHHLRSNWL